jgi:hypothetical protein
MKAGKDNPQAREEEIKLSLLRLECNSSLTGIPGMWELEFYGRDNAFCPPFAIPFSPTPGPLMQCTTPNPQTTMVNLTKELHKLLQAQKPTSSSTLPHPST